MGSQMADTIVGTLTALKGIQEIGCRLSGNVKKWYNVVILGHGCLEVSAMCGAGRVEMTSCTWICKPNERKDAKVD